MKKNNILFIMIFSGLIFTFAAFTIPDAHAIGGTIYGGPTCIAIGGSWDGVDVCSVTLLTINTGETLTVNQGVTLYNNGLITNNSGGTIDNYGVIINNLGSKISNSGDIADYGPPYYGGTFINSGTITNNSGGTINNYQGGTFTNSGTTTNNSGGTIIIYGGTINNLRGMIHNNGTITNFEIMFNSGVFDNNSGGTFNNSGGGIITNGTITNSGTIINNGTFYNYGTMTSNANITNSGFISNGLINGPIVIGNGTINNLGGILNNSGGGIINYPGSTISNTIGTITNSGSISKLCGSFIHNSGTITGNPIIYPPCDIIFTTGTGQTMFANQVSNKIMIQLQNDSGVPESAGVMGVSINLSTTSTGGKFSLLSSPFTPVTTLTIPTGSDSATFFYRDTMIGNPIISVSSKPLNPDTTTFTINPMIVHDPMQSTKDLVLLVDGMHLKKGTTESLDEKLKDVTKDLTKGQNSGARKDLVQFIDKVKDQTGKSITTIQSTQLTSAAKAIIDSLPNSVKEKHDKHNPPPVTQDIVSIVAGSGASLSATCVSTNNCFNPNPATIAPGTTIIWQNSDAVSHTVTSGKVTDANPGSLFDSGLVKPGSTFQFTFTNAGTYYYFDAVHPWMTGQIIVH